MSFEDASRSIDRRFLYGGIAVVIAVVGAVLLWPKPKPESIDLVAALTPAPPETLTLDAARARSLGEQQLVAAQRIQVHGDVVLPDDRVVVANALAFDPGSRLVARGGTLTVIASLVQSASIDASGPNGKDGAGVGRSGADGQTGGALFFVAGRVDGGELVANGGIGGNGRAGGVGAKGADGYCGPHGYRVAERGKAGSDGGAAGNGGQGGFIKVWIAEGKPVLRVEGGAAGHPGKGGAGGEGGKGCHGVRGKQDPQAPGHDGDVGRPGDAGGLGMTTVRYVEFGDVATAVARWAASQDRTPAALRDELLRLPIAPEPQPTQ